MSGFDIFFDGNNLIRLFQGLLVVVKLSVISLILGLILGVVLGILRTTSFKVIRVVLKIYLEIFRVVPLLVLLFVFYYIVPELLNSEVSNQVVSISVFILWISAEMSDLVRSGIENVPVQQIEIPFIPVVIILLTWVIMSTSLLIMIGVTEMIRVGTQIIENYTVKVPTASLWVYGLIFFLYFALCYPLSKLAAYVERRQVNG